MPPATLVIGAALAIVVAAAAWRFDSLSPSGAVAAAVLGTVALAAGWDWGGMLVCYFVSAAALSRFRAGEKERRTGDRLEKGARRDVAQVLANGGVFGVAALGFLGSGDVAWQALAAGALAASAADTWATEIGVLAKRVPRSIVTFRPVPVGTSGGVTARGCAGGFAGALFVAALAWGVRWPWMVGASAVIGGIAGMLLDSIAGATVQCRRWCHACHADTERTVHGCGTRTDVTGGLRWLDNDGVNALATVGGALVSGLMLAAAH